MAGNLTLAIIKPHIHLERKVGEVLMEIEKAGFGILLCKTIQLLPQGVALFYEEHVGKDFYSRLEKVMTSGPCWPLVLTKENAVATWREVIGSTNPAEAAEGTLRHRFGDHNFMPNNAVHGSADDWAAQREIMFFFSQELGIAKSVKNMMD